MHYTRCALCPNLNPCIPPDGQGDILFIGEAPGKKENAHKPPRVFIGPTGQECNQHYLPLAGLQRSAVEFTNAIRCLPVSYGGKLNPSRPKDVALLESCVSTHLYPQIEHGGYRLLVPLGSFACRAILGPDFDLELRHGIPAETVWGIPAFPMFHPALGLYEPKKMLYLRTDWQRLRSYLSGRLRVQSDEYLEPDYAEVTDADEIQEIDVERDIACDTESKRDGSPYCLTYSQDAGRGRLIQAEHTGLLLEFRRRVAQGRGRILFHNWLYDWAITEAMGLQLPVERIVDSMQFAFHLGNLPQGLKALALRELGMTMQDFDDLVTPYSRQLVIEYYERAQSITWPKPDEELVMDDKTGLWKLYRPQGMSTKFKRFFTDLRKSPDTKDVFTMWTDNWVAQQPAIEAECGEWPGKCISHVPFQEALYYACRDADALIRLWPLLKRMRSQVRHRSQEHWSGRLL